MNSRQQTLFDLLAKVANDPFTVEDATNPGGRYLNQDAIFHSESDCEIIRSTLRANSIISKPYSAYLPTVTLIPL